MMVEGGGRWGYDDIWIKEKKEEKKPETETEVIKADKVKPEEESEHKPVPDNEAQAND